MSAVPITTQLDKDPTQLDEDPTQSSQSKGTFVFVHPHNKKMTNLQSSLMKESKDCLIGVFLTEPKSENELDEISRERKVFIIPRREESLIEKIRESFENKNKNKNEKKKKMPLIYLPRTIIEAKDHFKKDEMSLPVRTLAISLTMNDCHIFLVKTLSKDEDLKRKINEMSGTIVSSFSSEKLNVVITDRGDSTYCAKAHNRKKPVVSKKWVDDNYKMALKEERESFGLNAMSTVEQYQIKPFFGLRFMITGEILKIPEIVPLIKGNGGEIIYGNNRNSTHIVVRSKQDIPKKKTAKFEDKSKDESPKPPKIVDIDFLRLCYKSGYYLKKHKSKPNSATNIKEEPNSQVTSQLAENNTPPFDGLISEDGYQSNMPPPPQTTRPLRQQQPDNNIMDDMIRKAMSTIETAQTQQASTQMRRLPDPELRIEQTFEPSQQLYWTDKRA